MKTLLSALAVTLGVASATQAATFQAEFTNINQSNGALAALGADPNAATMTFTWEVDETAAPLSGPYTYNYSYYYTYDYAYLSYESYSVQVGGVTLDADPSINTSDYIYVRDGLSSGVYNIQDYFQIYSYTGRSLTNGWRLDYIYMYLYDHGNGAFSGTDHPSFGELKDLDAYGYGAIRLYNTLTGTYAYVTSNTLPTITQVNAIPLPAGAPLLIGGLLGLALLRRRQRG